MTLTASFGPSSTLVDTHQHHLNPEMESCIEACLSCYHVCREGASYALKTGGGTSTREHIELMNDCAEICRASADFMIRNSPRHALTCRVCAEICQMCAESCDEIGDAFTKECAHICRSCAASCAEMSRH